MGAHGSARFPAQASAPRGRPRGAARRAAGGGAHQLGRHHPFGACSQTGAAAASPGRRGSIHIAREPPGRQLGAVQPSPRGKQWQTLGQAGNGGRRCVCLFRGEARIKGANRKPAGGCALGQGAPSARAARRAGARAAVGGWCSALARAAWLGRAEVAAMVGQRGGGVRLAARPAGPGRGWPVGVRGGLGSCSYASYR